MWIAHQQKTKGEANSKMRITTYVQALGAAAALAMLSGCSANDFIENARSVTAASHTRAAHFNALSGIAPEFLESIHLGGPVHGVNPNTPGPKELAVSDFLSAGNEILDHNFALKQYISDPAGCPDGNFYDRVGRLYVTEYCGSAVEEYDQSGNLLFTYTASGMTDPANVTTDGANNVFVDDYGGGKASVLVEFPQGSSTPLESCPTGLANEGVAVDSTGAVFVSGNDPTTSKGRLLEYPRGLAGCPTPKTLDVTLGFAGGLQLDNADDLVACDQIIGVVDIIPPPYTSISSTITGALDAFHVDLNKKNGKIFITDPGSATVLVDLYPSGTPFAVLGSANGLSDPASATAYPSKP